MPDFPMFFYTEAGKRRPLNCLAPMTWPLKLLLQHSGAPSHHMCEIQGSVTIFGANHQTVIQKRWGQNQIPLVLTEEDHVTPLCPQSPTPASSPWEIPCTTQWCRLDVLEKNLSGMEDSLATQIWLLRRLPDTHLTQWIPLQPYQGQMYCDGFCGFSLAPSIQASFFLP